MTLRTSAVARTTALLAAAVVALSGCASAATPTAEPTASAAESITVSDAWVKAADSGMSAAFGTLTNDSATDATLVSVTSPASTMLQLHETVENDAGAMVMQEKDGGFRIPAHSSLRLQPGADHIMLMDLTAPLAAGHDATFTLTFSDGSSRELIAPVKDYSGANETYEGGESSTTPTPAPGH